MNRLTIKLVDERGHTVCVFRQTPAHGRTVTPDETRGGRLSFLPAMAGRGRPYWTVIDKPLSRKLKRHIQPQLDAEGYAAIPKLGGPKNGLVTYEAGLPVRLEVPSRFDGDVALSLRWEKVVGILDSLATEGKVTVTLAEFRRRVDQ